MGMQSAAVRPQQLCTISNDRNYLNGRSSRPALSVSHRRSRASRAASRAAVAQMSAGGGPTPTEGWWTKDIPENMYHVSTVQELVDQLAEAAKLDQLLVLDTFAPWCGACRALFPKLKKLCVEHSDVRFVTVNFDSPQGKSIARALGVKVLPFFMFYRGAEGKVDAFSASVSKVARLREAIEDHKSPRCCLLDPPVNFLPEFPTVFPGSSTAEEVPPASTPEMVA